MSTRSKKTAQYKENKNIVSTFVREFINVLVLSRKVEGIDPLKPWQPPDLFGEGAKFY